MKVPTLCKSIERQEVRSEERTERTDWAAKQTDRKFDRLTVRQPSRLTDRQAGKQVISQLLLGGSDIDIAKFRNPCFAQRARTFIGFPNSNFS